MSPGSMIALLLPLQLVAQGPAAAREQPGEWVVIESKEGGFSFAMPGRPFEDAKEQQTPDGKSRWKTYFCSSGKRALLLKHEVFPRPVRLDGALDAWEAQIVGLVPGKGRILSKRPIARGDLRGRELVVTSTSDAGVLTYKIHVYIRRGDLILLTASGGPGGALPPESDAFFESIGFDGKPAVRPAMAATAKAPARPEPPPLPAMREPIGKIERADTTADSAVRTFLMAMAAADEATLREVSLSHAELDWLLRGEGGRGRGLRELKAEIIKARVERLKEGDRARTADGKVHMMLAEEVRRDRAALKVQGTPFYVPLRCIKGHWKVDPSPFIAVLKAAAGVK